MAYALNPDHLSVAFAGGALIDAGKPVRFRIIDAGRLTITSEHIAASDPLVMPNPAGFTQRVSPGVYPVTLAVAVLENEDERVAFAQVRLLDLAPSRWEMALHEEQQPGTLGYDEYFGYGVDSGTGCFMDPAAGKLLEERMALDSEYYNVIIDGMEKTYRHTRSWLEFRPSSDRAENVVCFSSGFGDGSYPSFFGFVDDGRPAALVTDFLVLMGDVPEPAERQNPWWKFWVAKTKQGAK